MQCLAQGLETVRVIERTGKPVAAILPPGIGRVGLGSQRGAVPAGIHGIGVDRDVVVVDPLNEGEFSRNRLGAPRADNNRAGKRMRTTLRSVVRQQQATPAVLRVLPVRLALRGGPA